jgi:signal peptidase I
VVALLIATSFKPAIADWNVVPTGSMKPTIVEGDRIFVNKLAYDLKVPYTTWHLAQWGEPHRGDIVVFYSPVDGQRLVKRVIGIPGDTVTMRHNRLEINGKRLRYEPLEIAPEMGTGHLGLREFLGDVQHPVMTPPRQPARRAFGPLTLPEGQYLMMGDNRADSRYFGLVDRSLVVGRATSIVISLDTGNWWKPRWRRFFTALR